MGAEKTLTASFARPAAEVFAAVQQIGSAWDWTTHDLDPTGLRLVAQTGKTALSWGHIMIVEVQTQGDTAVLQLGVTVVPSAPKALLDGRKNKKIGEKFIAELTSALA